MGVSSGKMREEPVLSANQTFIRRDYWSLPECFGHGLNWLTIGPQFSSPFGTSREYLSVRHFLLMESPQSGSWILDTWFIYFYFFFFTETWENPIHPSGLSQEVFYCYNLIMLISSQLLKRPSDSSSPPCLVHRPSLDVTTRWLV